MNCYFENGICVMVPMTNEEWTNMVSKALGVFQEQISITADGEMPIFSLNIDSIRSKGGK